MPDAFANIEASGLREIRAMLLEIKDNVVGRVARNGSLSSVEVIRLQNLVRGLNTADLGDEMEDILSRYMRWSYEDGIEKIDRIISGEKLGDVLNLPEENLEVVSTYNAGLIKTIAPELLDDVARKISLAAMGQRTPQEIANDIARTFDKSIHRAETITRTETKRLQNFGAEKRIQTAAGKAQRLGIPVKKVWIHSSGSVEGYRKGKYRAKYDPREHHKLMHGTAINPSEKFRLVNFETGDVWLIDGPHDEALPAGEVVNCYCDRAIRIDREAIDLDRQRKAA